MRRLLMFFAGCAVALSGCALPDWIAPSSEKQHERCERYGGTYEWQPRSGQVDKHTCVYGDDR